MLTSDSGVGAIQHLDSARARLTGLPSPLVADEELLPLSGENLDLIVSLLTLHTVNDLIGALVQARHALRPDGLFIAAVFGEETLSNLRHALYTAEAEITGGVAARIAPFASVQDLGHALSRAGFALPVTDIDKVRVEYRDPMKLIHDLRAIGETCPLSGHPPALRRDVWFRAMEVFQQNGSTERFDIVFLTGWGPHDSQQKPLNPGSAKTSFEKAITGSSLSSEP
jgi:SAM-dependent methyltransferase